MHDEGVVTATTPSSYIYQQKFNIVIFFLTSCSLLSLSLSLSLTSNIACTKFWQQSYNYFTKTSERPLLKKSKHIVLAGHYFHRFVIAHEVYSASHPEITPPSATSKLALLVFLLPYPPHRK